MNKIKVLMALFFAVVLVSCGVKSESEMKVATFNLRYDNPHDGVNSWVHRKQHVYDFVREQKLVVC